MPESDEDRTSILEPWWSGVRLLSSIEIFISASPSGAREMSSTEPTGIPPTFTWFPRTSWLAFRIENLTS